MIKKIFKIKQRVTKIYLIDWQTMKVLTFLLVTAYSAVHARGTVVCVSVTPALTAVVSSHCELPGNFILRAASHSPVPWGGGFDRVTPPC